MCAWDGGFAVGFENIVLEKHAPIATITIDRPKVLNALNRATLEELSSAFEEVAADPEVRVILLTGAGPKAFVAGADISELAQLDAENGRAYARRG
jgi:enoyl-CoA hydratase